MGPRLTEALGCPGTRTGTYKNYIGLISPRLLGYALGISPKKHQSGQKSLAAHRTFSLSRAEIVGIHRHSELRGLDDDNPASRLSLVSPQAQFHTNSDTFIPDRFKPSKKLTRTIQSSEVIPGTH